VIAEWTKQNPLKWFVWIDFNNNGKTVCVGMMSERNLAQAECRMLLLDEFPVDTLYSLS